MGDQVGDGSQADGLGFIGVAGVDQVGAQQPERGVELLDEAERDFDPAQMKGALTSAPVSTARNAVTFSDQIVDGSQTDGLGPVGVAGVDQVGAQQPERGVELLDEAERDFDPAQMKGALTSAPVSTALTGVSYGRSPWSVVEVAAHSAAASWSGGDGGLGQLMHDDQAAAVGVGVFTGSGYLRRSAVGDGDLNRGLVQLDADGERRTR
ncbi:hypothetical protein OG339_48160 (plasmid) [Streptosporangium sp. NBC_01495]|nr:hypothetical protein [Streptosporangium sp. NBC_01495]